MAVPHGFAGWRADLRTAATGAVRVSFALVHSMSHEDGEHGDIRWVRRFRTDPDGVTSQPVEIVLQQCYARCGGGDEGPVEWRDVPLVDELE
jgi:hypothetical protein